MERIHRPVEIYIHPLEYDFYPPGHIINPIIWLFHPPEAQKKADYLLIDACGDAYKVN